MSETKPYRLDVRLPRELLKKLDALRAGLAKNSKMKVSRAKTVQIILKQFFDS